MSSKIFRYWQISGVVFVFTYRTAQVLQEPRETLVGKAGKVD
jgi:hypothetical protein